MNYRSFHAIILAVTPCLASFTASAQIARPLAPSNVCVNNTCVTAASPTRSSTGIKWHPGHYVLSDQADFYNGTPGLNQSYVNACINEIKQAFANPNVLGYMTFNFWASLEPTQGHYNWANIDAIRSYIATHYPGKRYAITIDTAGLNRKDPTQVVPGYVLSNPTYGAGYDGTRYGWWLANVDAVAAWWRPAVSARLQALYAALAAHTSPYGGGSYTYDTDPYFEAVTTQQETSISLVSTPPDYTVSGAIEQEEAQIAAALQAFRHTNVMDMNNYLYNGSLGDSAQLMVHDGNAGAAMAGPDVVYGPPDTWTWGQQAYRGQAASSGYGTDYFRIFPHLTHIEFLDYFTNNPTMAQLFTTATSSNPTQGLGASHIFWLIQSQGNGVAGDWATLVSPFIASNLIPSANQGCPSVYSSVRGGCVTN